MNIKKERSSREDKKDLTTQQMKDIIKYSEENLSLSQRIYRDNSKYHWEV